MFLAPALLFGLLAVGLPIWLHRMTRANPPQQPFASLMFLEPSETQRSAKRSIRYWLLLLLRIALIAALAFAFAGPLAPERIAPATEADVRLHAIVVDASYSMQHGERWRRALEQAESIVRNARGADRVMLVRAAGRRVEVVHEAVPASNAGSLLAALQALQPSLERLDFGLVMSTADGWLGSPRPPTTLSFISDLQASGAPLHFADLEPPPGAQLVMHSVANERAPNASVTDARFGENDATTLQASVRHDSPEPQQREVVLLVDSKEIARQRLDLAAAPVSPAPRPAAIAAESEGGSLGLQPPLLASQGGALTSTLVEFPNIALTPGPHRLEIRLEPHDALPQDDAHFAVIEHADPKALLIAQDEDADEVAYFEAALGSLTAPQLSVERRSTQELPDPGALSAYSLVVIPDAGALSTSAAARVLEYASGGGAVLATLGARREAGESPLLPEWRIGAMRNQPARVGEISTSHPALRDANEWRRVRFFRARDVEIGRDDKVLLAFEDGAPLLVERVVGAGRVLALTAPIDRSWNDLAIHPLFVQFIANAGRDLTGADAAPTSHVAGGVVMTGLTAAAGGQIFDPRGERVLSLSAGDSVERLIPQATGFYEVRGAAARWLAVNVDPRESDLAPLDSDFVRRWQALRMRAPTPVDATVDAAQPTAAPRSLGWLLLWLAAALLIAELLLANRHLAIRRA